MRLPAELPPQAIVALIDSREQMPLELGMTCERATLATGDYSVRGLQRFVAIERKSLGDLLACCGRERERFDREVQRLLAYPTRALVVEASWGEIELGQWRSQLTSKQVGASLVSWIAQGLPVVMAGSRDRAAGITASILRRAAIHRYRELREFAKGVEQ